MERPTKRAVWIGLSAVTLIAVLVLGKGGLHDPGSEEQSSGESPLGEIVVGPGDYSATSGEVPASAKTSNTSNKWVVRGVVVDSAGFEVGGAAIDVWNADDNETQPHCRGRDAVLQAQVSSDRQGAFELSLPEEELFCVRARHASSGSESVLVSTGERRTESIRLVLEPSKQVNGRVVDATNAAVASVEIELLRQDGPAIDEPNRATTDGNGLFSFQRVAPGDYLLRSTTGKHVISKPREVSLGADRPIDDLLVQIDAMVAITGRVVDAAGKPLPNVKLVARSPYDPELFLGSTTSTDTGAFVLPSEQRSAAARMAQRMAGGIVVDKSGTEARAPLGAEGVCVEFEYPYLEAEAQSVVANGTAFDIGTVYLRPSRPISGQLLDSAGRPLAARIVLREIARTDGRAACSALPAVREVRSSAEGIFTVQLKPGRYEAQVYEKAALAKSIEVTASEGESLILKVE